MMARVLIVAIALLTVPAAAPQTPQAPQPPASSPQQWTPPDPMNLQVLPKSISKGDLVGTMKSFTRALGGESPRHGVRVFGVNPSRTRTDRVLTLARQRAQARWGDESKWQETLSDLPFGRLMEPAEVADMIVFGASPRAGYLSGTVIDLDGGEQYAAHGR